MSRIREKQTFSGPLLEVDFYPVFNDGRRLPRGPKQKRTEEEQQRYNTKQAIKKLIRLVNANFDNTDYWFHPTYTSWLAPQDEESARRDIVNYFRRVKRARKKALRDLKAELAEAEAAAGAVGGNHFLEKHIARLQKKIAKLEEPFRYIYAIEKQVYKTGENAGRINWHFHAFTTGGLDAAVMEDLWPYGVRVNVNRFQPERFGPAAAARYMSKDPQGFKRFASSRNLLREGNGITVRHRTGRISARTVERIAKERFDDRAYWEKKYPGYRFLRCYRVWNEWNSHWYVSAVMYQAGGPLPKWEEDEWITEA